MANLGQTFDSGSHDDMQSGFDPIPAGDYMVIVKESDLLVTSKKNGKYIKLKFEVIEGEFKGRLIWTNLNIINPNPVAVEIAQKELATLCRAVGKPVIQDTQELHGIPIRMKVKVKPAKGDYPAGNEPIGYTSATVQADQGPTRGVSTDTSPEGDWPDGEEDDDIPF